VHQSTVSELRHPRVSNGLENEVSHSSLHHDAPNLTQLSLLMAVASVWVHIVGKHLYERHANEEGFGPGNSEVDLAARRDILL
jgi:hypothetical protein